MGPRQRHAAHMTIGPESLPFPSLLASLQPSTGRRKSVFRGSSSSLDQQRNAPGPTMLRRTPPLRKQRNESVAKTIRRAHSRWQQVFPFLPPSSFVASSLEALPPAFLSLFLSVAFSFLIRRFALSVNAQTFTFIHLYATQAPLPSSP